MKFHLVAAILAFPALSWAATGSDTAGKAAGRAPADVGQLIRDLADERFRVREDATRELWRMGDDALDELKKAAASRDPEQAFRARELIRKIDLFITPTTDPSVVALVEEYRKASISEKTNLLDRMRQKRAWRQLLKLYAAETHPEIRGPYDEKVEEAAIVAARESLLQGDAEEAQEFLELAPATPSGLMALADFHRAQGTLAAELERAELLAGPKGAAWRVALHRAAGDLKAAREAAVAAGDDEIAAGMALLEGDPIPWLRRSSAHGDVVSKTYTPLAIRRWSGETLTAEDLEPLVKMTKKRSSSTRLAATNALFLLGRPETAEPAFQKQSPLAAFLYFSKLERLDEALTALGLDPARPDYEGWVGERFATLLKPAEEEDNSGRLKTLELLALANFLEANGLQGEAASAFTKPLLTLAEEDARRFRDFLSYLFNGAPPIFGSPQLAEQVVVAWAGDDDARWSEVIDIVTEVPDLAAVWSWMEEMDADQPRPARLEAFLAVVGLTPDPQRLGRAWMERFWKDYDAAPAAQKPQLLGRIGLIYLRAPDVEGNLRRYDILAPRADVSEFLADLTAAGRWKEVADFRMRQVREMEKSGAEPEPWLHAYAASALRRAGRPQEAAEQDGWVDRLALSRDAAVIAAAYADGEDFEKSTEWIKKAARETSLETLAAVADDNLLDSLVAVHLAEGRWKTAAAINEMIGRLTCAAGAYTSPMEALQVRAGSDLGRALAMAPTRRSEAVSLLAECRRLFPSDGWMADDYFPALRRAGLLAEHDAAFAESWRRVTALVERFPEGENHYNTAAWVASRACSQLDDAERQVRRALELNPDQPAYLDTLAEIYFARGDRAGAVKWSERALNFGPEDVQLRQQHRRFLTAPFPK